MTENEKVIEPTSDTIKIPEFMKSSISAATTDKIKQKSLELKYIKGNEGKNWSVLKELDELIGAIISREVKPEKIKITYNILFNSNNKTEKIKGIITQ